MYMPRTLAWTRNQSCNTREREDLRKETIRPPLVAHSVRRDGRCPAGCFARLNEILAIERLVHAQGLVQI